VSERERKEEEEVEISEGVKRGVEKKKEVKYQRAEVFDSLLLYLAFLSHLTWTFFPPATPRAGDSMTAAAAAVVGRRLAVSS